MEHKSTCSLSTIQAFWASLTHKYSKTGHNNTLYLNTGPWLNLVLLSKSKCRCLTEFFHQPVKGWTVTIDSISLLAVSSVVCGREPRVWQSMCELFHYRWFTQYNRVYMTEYYSSGYFLPHFFVIKLVFRLLKG